MVLDPFSMLEEEDETPEEFGGAVGDLPAATFWGFIAAALLAQAGLLAASLGIMYAVILNRARLGAALFALGVLALAGTVAIYRWHRARD